MRVAIVLLLLAGCADRQHVYYKTGIAEQSAMARQAQPHEGAAPRGLDAEDAEIVMTNYRSASTRKGQTSLVTPILPALPTTADYGSAMEAPAGGAPPGGIQLQAK
jgi:hypothetical protein